MCSHGMLKMVYCVYSWRSVACSRGMLKMVYCVYSWRSVICSH